jgi:hypothetical protein
VAAKPFVTLPDALFDKSRRWAQQVVDDYAAGRKARSRAMSCFDAESNVALQAAARMCECAFCVWAGLDPHQALDWGRHCDGGFDVSWRGRKWDVKATKMTGRFLIWPVAKNHIYEAKRFDALVLVKHDVPLFQIAGWVSKEHFRAHHSVAAAGHKLFAGTRHMHERDLWDMDRAREDP